MRPQSFRQPLPPNRPFNQFQGPRGNYGARPPRFPFPQPGMQPPPIQGQGPAPGLGIGTGGATPRLQSIMDTANRFLATAQSFQPLVQQATPMFRNLPALWRLYKGFQGLPKTSASKDDESGEQFDFDESLESPEMFAKPEKAVKEKTVEKHNRPEKPARPEMFKRPARPASRDRFEEYDSFESPTITERVKPKKVSTRPSVPRIFQPPYHFDE
ncbi:VrrA/YqfQ family protein [Ureibacillus aquaedulcis]|uniref:VrrA/YqfQ family protein n=1 Tax=Ureibacillus aquaedulcis TaxID=3058421 RepID=A0ABT8GPA9_9BACL|nr:VrrA/YqfQ family protein [Ureibacillus sp. BA0131]MDN4493248.1 VrrA/YqfQ family protein [Ureibacillus sp. BA0131]